MCTYLVYVPSGMPRYSLHSLCETATLEYSMYIGTYVRMYVYEHYIKICWHSKFPLLSQGTYLLFSAKGTLVETSITAKVMG